MFTGLVEEVGIVRRLERRGEGGRLSISAKTVLDGTRLGDSIAVSGACLTVVEIGGDGFVADCMPETLTHTTLGAASPGMPVNLERSLALGGRLGGHLVLGHVDAVGEVFEMRRDGIAWRLRLSLPVEVRSCVAPRGSVAIDGISLTVITSDDASFEVGIIPHTAAQTTLRVVRPGGAVNLEADVLARYVLRAVQVLGGGEEESVGSTRSGGGLTESILREQGFI